MDHFYDRLLLNALIVISGPLIIQLFIHSTLHSSRKWSSLIIGLVMTLDQILCVMFPLQIIPDFRVDLRIVPMVIGTLYGGLPVSLVLTGAFLIQRLAIGGADTAMAILLYTLCIFITLALRRVYQQLSKWQRIAFATLPTAIVAAFSNVFIYVHVSPTKGTASLLALYTSANLLMLWITVLVIENTDENFHMREEIHRAEKYHVLGELAASIAHEIRNPMTVARGFLQLATEATSLQQVQTQYLGTAIAEIDRAHTIINNYLSLAKPQFGLNAHTNIAVTIQNVVELLRPYATLNNVTVAYTINQESFVYANPEYLLQMLVNIAKNGIEAMPQGGTLNIKAGCEKEWCLIDISDTGIGMTKEQIQRLGHPFYSTKSNGTGLGLMTSYRLCQNMNGQIAVESTSGKGSCFKIKLPVDRVADPASADEKVNSGVTV